MGRMKISHKSIHHLRESGKSAPASVVSAAGFSSPGRVSFAMDEILDLMTRFPWFAGYFAEKLRTIARLEFLLANPAHRAQGETAAFLKFWIRHFSLQIYSTGQWLLNGNGHDKIIPGSQRTTR